MKKRTLFVDTETSGMPDFKAPPSDLRQPWIVQIAAVLSDSERIYQSVNLVVKANGRIIEPGAQAVHGYSQQMTDLFGVDEKTVSSVLCALFASADLAVCHNVNFDCLVMQSLFHRQNSRYGLTLLDAIPSVCTMKASTNLLKIPGRFGYKWPSLKELHEYLFQEGFEGAHDAMADITATRRCYYELLKRGVIEE